MRLGTLVLLCASCMAQVGLPWPGPGGVSAAPTNVTAISAAVTGQHPVISLTGSAAIGDVVLVASSNDAGANFTMSAADSQSNCSGYTQIEAQNAGLNSSSELFYCKITSALAGGTDTITITNPTFINANWIAYKLTGTTGVLDQTVNSGTGGVGQNPITTGTLSPGSASTVAFAIFGIGPIGAWSAYGNIMGAAATGLNNTSVQDNVLLATEWAALSSSTPGTATMVPTSAQKSSWIFVTFK